MTHIGSARVEGKPRLIDLEDIGKPVDHQLLAECRVVVLAVLGSGFFFARQAERSLDAMA